MRISLKEKIEMCEKHILKGKSLSRVYEMYDKYDIENLKYIVNLYNIHG